MNTKIKHINISSHFIEYEIYDEKIELIKINSNSI